MKKYDFHPEIKSGVVGNINSAVLYALDGIGDLIVASSIVKYVVENCKGKVYFICSPSSFLYIDLLKKKYSNIEVFSFFTHESITSGDVENIAVEINSKSSVDLVINTIGRITPHFAELASLLNPKSVFSCIESKRKVNQNKMTHNAVKCSSLLFRNKVNYADCWGMFTQIIGGKYDRKNLFPIENNSLQKIPEKYIVLSLSGVSRGAVSEDNAIKICEIISRYYSGQICLVVSPGLEKLCGKISSKLKNVFIPQEEVSIETTGAYIKHAYALISICSAPIHIAGAFNTPTLVISSLYAPHWFPIVDTWDIYVTDSPSINSINFHAFEKLFCNFIKRI